MKKIRAIADWIRRGLRATKAEDAARKLQALRQATAHSFPTADIEEVLGQIEGGERGFGMLQRLARRRTASIVEMRAAVRQRAKAKYSVKRD